MTLDEAIRHASEVADKSDVCPSCATEHKQLAAWLNELKHLRSTRDELVSSLNEAVTIQSEHCVDAYDRDHGDRCGQADGSCDVQRWRKALEKAGG